VGRVGEEGERWGRVRVSNAGQAGVRAEQTDAH
jgi:hypothetical protein